MNKAIVGISSYSSYLKISVFNGSKYLGFSKEVINFEELMFKKINSMLLKFKLDFKDISAVCIVKGPGRFTGIRSSYTFASVYNVISGAQVYGIDVFKLFVYNIFENDKTDKRVRVVLNAFKDEYYISEYLIENRKIKNIISPKWVYEKKLLKMMRNFDGILISDDEDNKKVYEIFKDYKKADERLSRVIPENIIKACLYFKEKDIKPYYLKLAKFEL